jgi:hypothetical protein
MTVLGKGWAAENITAGSSYVASGLNARNTPLLAVTLQFVSITVSANRTENTFPTGILIITRVTVATLTWCLLLCNIVTVITLALSYQLRNSLIPTNTRRITLKNRNVNFI